MKYERTKTRRCSSVKGDTKNRENWKIEKIVSLPTGADGSCRVAKVKVGDTEFTRSINHLYPLEIEDDMPVLKSRIPIKENLKPHSNFPRHSVPIVQPSEPASTSAVNLQPDMEVASPEREITQDSVTAALDVVPDTDLNMLGNNPDENHTQTKKTRVASQQVRERIREWTRQLNATF